MKISTAPCGLLSANMYVVQNNQGQAIVIDPIDADVLQGVLKLTSLSVKGVLLTHAHYDHASGLEKIKALTHASSYIHLEDADFLSDPRKNFSFFLSCPENLGSCEHLLSNDDIINLAGFSIRVLHTPGHTPGSVCYLIENALFSGDTVFANGIGRCDLYGGDPRAMRTSLTTLMSLQQDYTVYPGHGPSSKLSSIIPTLKYYL